MNIAIAGASGFIGRNLSKLAKERGYRVLGLVRSEESKRKIEGLCSMVKVVDFFDINSLEKAIKNCEIVYHFIGISRESKDETFEKVNFLLTKLMLEACKRVRVKRFITNSGLGVANYNKNPFVTNRYFLSKLMAEKIIMEKSDEVSYTIFRPSYILGEEDEMTPYLVERIKKGEVTIVGNGEYRFQPIYIKDASEIYLKCLEVKNSKNTIFDLVGDDIVSYKDYLKMIIDRLLKKGEIYKSPKVSFISVEEAKREDNPLGLAKEEVDVLLCDELSDSTKIKETFNIRLTPLKEILDRIIFGP
ncbi:MAG: NAD-dependent epimerase/dehydratase family protein [Nitrososphaerales archaeon]